MALPARMPESSGTTVYVATTGNDTTGTGAIGAPYLTINKGIQALTDGVGGIVYVRAGTYASQVENWNRDGAAGNPVTVAAYNGEAVTITGRVEVMEPYFRMRGITIANPGDGSTPSVYLEHHTNVPASNVELDQCIIEDSLCDGIFIEGAATAATRCDNFQMHRCIIRNNGTSATLEHGFYPKWATNWVVSDCLFYGNAASNAHIGNASDGGILANSTLVRPGGIESAIIWSEATGERSDNNLIVNCILATELVNKDVFETTWGGGTAGTGNSIDQTIAHGASGTGVNFNTANGGVTLGTTSEEDPLFVDPGADDWRVLAGSPAIGYADPAYESATDFNGDARTTGVVGAFGVAVSIGTPSDFTLLGIG